MADYIATTINDSPVIVDTLAPSTPVAEMDFDRSGSFVAAVAEKQYRHLQEVINVKDRGAVGDGVTDDSVAVQAAITAAESSGAIVYFPAATYSFATTLTRPTNVRLRGDGKGKSILSYTGSGTALGVAASGVRTYRAGVFDLTLTTSTGDIGIDLDSVSLAVFERLDVTGFSGKGIRLVSPTSGYCVYNRFWDVTVQAPTYPNTARGFSIEGTSSNANTFDSCRTNLCFRGFHLDDSNDNTFDKCQAESGGTGFYLTSTAPGLCDWNRILDCRSENNATYGIDIATVDVRHTVEFGTWFGTNGTDRHDLGTKTRRGAQELYINSSGTLLADLVISATNFVLSSTSGAFQAATGIGMYLRGNIANAANNVAVWLGNSTTLTNASSRIVGFCRDTPVTHAQPASYIRQDGAYEFATGGVLIISGSGTPEGAVTAPVGSLFLRSDGGAGTSMYVKQSGASNTGWVGK